MSEAKNGMKFFPKCQRVLPIELFGSDKSNKDNLQVYCKVCKREHLQNYRNRHKKDVVDIEKLKLVRKMLTMLEPYRTTV